MKKCFLTLAAFTIFFFISCSHNSNSLKNKTWVFDNEHDLTQNQIVMLDSLYKSHENKTTNEVALVTTADYGSDTSILFFAVHFARQMGIGKKDKNNGVVFVLNKTKNQVFIATGYGTEKVLKDEVVKNIIDSLMIPEFKKGKLFEGVWAGSVAVTSFLEKPENKIR